MKRLLFALVSIALFVSAGYALKSSADESQTSAHGKYANLIQVIECPRDQASYGDYRDYGWWRGGSWCGQQGKTGYWVWVYPKWYVWRHKQGVRQEVPRAASAYGKYSQLKQVLTCSRDRSRYGDYRDYGWWRGGRWCGRHGKSGYWVYVYPKWYVWRRRH